MEIFIENDKNNDVNSKNKNGTKSNNNAEDVDAGPKKVNTSSSLGNSFVSSHQEVTPSSSLPSATQSLLLPPPPYQCERRGSTSSIDSSQHSSCIKRHNKSLTRLSELQNIHHDVTLMTFVRKIRNAAHNSYALVWRTLVKVLAKSRRCPTLVCEAEVMDETDKICRDYIVHKMTLRDIMSWKVSITCSDWPKSSHVIAAGMALEHIYPRTFSNVSRKLCMTMSSPKIVRSALTSVLEVLFEGEITWGKMVAMMSISALFAEECASQGHADFVVEVVDTVMETNTKLLEWLVLQGGWTSFPWPKRDEDLTVSVKKTLAFLGLSTTIAISFNWLFHQW